MAVFKTKAASRRERGDRRARSDRQFSALSVISARVAVALLLLVPLSTVFHAEKLTERNYRTIRDHILPSEEEESWRKVEWRATFWDGVIDAQKEDKPIMLFAMNGHPFGCT